MASTGIQTSFPSVQFLGLTAVPTKNSLFPICFSSGFSNAIPVRGSLLRNRTATPPLNASGDAFSVLTFCPTVRLATAHSNTVATAAATIVCLKRMFDPLGKSARTKGQRLPSYCPPNRGASSPMQLLTANLHRLRVGRGSVVAATAGPGYGLGGVAGTMRCDTSPFFSNSNSIFSPTLNCCFVMSSCTNIKRLNEMSRSCNHAARTATTTISHSKSRIVKRNIIAVDYLRECQPVT